MLPLNKLVGILSTSGTPISTPLQISGNVWTPNVDGSNNVLQADFDALGTSYVGTWFYVNTNVMDDVIPSPRRRRFLTGADGAFSICNAWCGGSWDWINQRLFCVGGGHADSNIAENGVYQFSVDTMRWSVAFTPSTEAEMMRWESSPGGQAGFQPILTYSDSRNQSGTCPMTDGKPPSSHTFDAVNWVPPSVAGNTNGSLVTFHDSIHVGNLDNGTYDTAHFDGAPAVDLSYKITFMDGWHLYHARAGSQFRHWDLSPTTRSSTLWSQSSYVTGGATSRGSYIGSISTGKYFEYSHKILIRMPARREVAVIAFWNGTPIRLRYGQAIDANNTTSWTTYTDDITLTSSDGSHSDFNATNLKDQGPNTTLYAAGVGYDHATETIYIVPNLTGGNVYRITGIATNTWTTEKLGNHAVLENCGNGTFDRVQLCVKGSHKFLIRVSSTTTRTQICAVS